MLFLDIVDLFDQFAIPLFLELDFIEMSLFESFDLPIVLILFSLILGQKFVVLLLTFGNEGVFHFPVVFKSDLMVFVDLLYFLLEHSLEFLGFDSHGLFGLDHFEV